MATHDDDAKNAERLQRLKEDPRTSPRIGPSDSSDTASELPDNFPDTDSDRRNTGERAEVENRRDPAGDDVQPDKVVPERDAGLSHSAPDPERNGG
ncbi:MatE family transporter [Pusillimonas sp.]|uniref:MatE family transporter n=1 Tax=Pusillimonas sp. TaxID=3040095 RepID=UPI0037C4F154